MKRSEEVMEILEAYDLTGSLRAAAALAGCDHKTVARWVAARDAAGGGLPAGVRARPAVDPFAEKIEEWVARSQGRVRADVAHQRLLAMGYSSVTHGRVTRPRPWRQRRFATATARRVVRSDPMVVLQTAKRAGLVGRRRVLDSTALYDAVATMDTVTLLRSAVRGLLRVCDGALERELRGVLGRDDDYRSAGKPVCDYDDRDAREGLVDALAKDAWALLGALDGRGLADAVGQAAALLAAVTGQDLDEGSDGVFRIARRVAKDRVISTVDPQARHGHKTAARGPRL